jgi:uncharacterized protein
VIYYLDTSALVKRYVAEPGSQAVRRTIGSKAVATCRIAYAELAATAARLAREGLMDTRARDRILGRLDGDFAAMTVVEVRPAVVRKAAEIVRRAPLRGYDAVHLASALVLAERGVSVDFWSADVALVRAASAEGLRATPLA